MKRLTDEEVELAKEHKKKLESLPSDKNDIFSLMMRNAAESREYYVISKTQATKTFTATLVICISGVFVFLSGIIFDIVLGTQDAIFYSTVLSGIVEIISGLFFWLYKKSQEQLNFYHEKLGATEKYLIAIQLAEKISQDKRDETYRYLIEVISIDNSFSARKSALSQKQ